MAANVVCPAGEQTALPRSQLDLRGILKVRKRRKGEGRVRRDGKKTPNELRPCLGVSTGVWHGATKTEIDVALWDN